MEADPGWVIVGAIWGLVIGQSLVIASMVFWEFFGERWWFTFRAWRGERRRARWAAKHPEEAARLRRAWKPYERQLNDAMRAHREAQDAYTVKQAEVNLRDAARDL